AGAGLAGLASFLIHPFGPVKAKASMDAPVFGAWVDPAVVRILERSCVNCHSERTEWPWYSYVAPMSWLIENDVQRARDHMNFSRWGQYDSEKRQEVFARLAAEVRSRQMPPARYTRLHPSARLSDEEMNVLYQWARTERKQLQR